MPLTSGSTAAAALRNMIDLERQVERSGYARYWLAEHHLTPSVACAAPAVLIADATVLDTVVAYRAAFRPSQTLRAPYVMVSADVGADELLITTVTHDHAARVRSYELLAQAWAGLD
nr:hypothetical protein [Frankia sp. Cr1]